MKFASLLRIGVLTAAGWALMPTSMIWASHEPSHEVDVAAIRQSALAAGDVDQGKKIFRKCRSCHKLGDGAKNGVGPVLTNVVGAKMGSVQAYKYSASIKDMYVEGMIWTIEALDAYVTKPKDFIAGTKMAIAGVKKAQDRADLIAYLASGADT
jgi:cytochrome c2